MESTNFKLNSVKVREIIIIQCYKIRKTHNQIAQLIISGRLPSALAFAFLTPEAFKGDYTRSRINFKSHGIDSFDLRVEGKSLSGYPLTQMGNQHLSYYYKFLRECNFYNNNYSSGSMTYDAFRDNNFIIVENLYRKKIRHGQLTLKLK